MAVEIRVLASSSAGNAYVVSDGRTPLLIECGLPFRQLRERLGYSVTSLAGCLLSHEHADHARAARDILRAGVDLYATRGTINALELTGHRLRPIRAHERFRVGTWTIHPFDTRHDAQEPVGFVLASGHARVLYLTDTAYCPYRFAGLTHVLIEANWSEALLGRNVREGMIDGALAARIRRNHMSLERLLDMLRANDLSRVEAIWLLHLSDQNSDEEMFARRVREVTGRPVYVAAREVR